MTDGGFEGQFSRVRGLPAGAAHCFQHPARSARGGRLCIHPFPNGDLARQHLHLRPLLISASSILACGAALPQLRARLSRRSRLYGQYHLNPLCVGFAYCPTVRFDSLADFSLTFVCLACGEHVLPFYIYFRSTVYHTAWQIAMLVLSFLSSFFSFILSILPTAFCITYATDKAWICFTTCVHHVWCVACSDTIDKRYTLGTC